MKPRAALVLLLAASTACSSGGQNQTGDASKGTPGHSSPIAVSPDGTRLYVVHPDADSISILDKASHAIDHEVLLASQPVAFDAATNRYDPAVTPRALALDSQGKTVYVTGERSGHLYAVDATAGTVTKDVFVCSEPIGVVVSPDDQHVFVACSQDDEVVEVAASGLTIEGQVSCPRKPWSLAWSADGSTLLATHLLGPGVSAFTAQPFALKATWTLADGPAASDGDATEPHGQVRGIYDVAPRPGTTDLWVAHLMLGTDTPQPALDFLRTVFPAVSILDATGAQTARLTVSTNVGDNGAFEDVVSGPRAITFSDDGHYAFVVDTDSEDVLVIDATASPPVEATIVRHSVSATGGGVDTLQGHLPEGLVYDHGELYVQERNTEDIVAFTVSGADGGLSMQQDGAPFPTVSSDPMPANLRVGQKLFFSADSDDVPTTQDHWVSCAACHIEGRSSAVTWDVTEGPRDTPSNGGGMIGTGFLFRTADCSQVQDYWQTIDQEQGGHFSITVPAQSALLDELAAYVNEAIPVPVPPQPTDTTALARGEALFNNPTQTNCTCCHSGPYKTDSGSGNPTLDLSGPIVLHDVGTCVTSGPFPDVAHTDIDGNPRAACDFDTPALRGLWDSAPYLHDGSALTLDDALAVMLTATAPACPTASPTLSQDDRAALVEYLRSL